MGKKWLVAGFLCVTLGLGLSSGVQADASYCYNGHQYFLTDQAYNWQDAENYAKNKGGHLVAINDAAEQDFLQTNFNPYSGGGDDEAKQRWIGATDQESEGVWKWSSGQAFSYTNWNTATGEPNNSGGNENFATIWRFTSGTWNDVPGSNSYLGIVEVPTCPAPIPGSLLLLGSILLPVLGLRKRLQ